MIETVIKAGLRLAEALRAENEALAKLDLPAAAALATPKMQATDAFAAACTAAQRTGTKVAGPERGTATEMATRLASLSAENRRLLERAVAIQSRVIETIAGAARPAQNGPAGYGAAGRYRAPPTTRPMAIATRA